MASAAEQMASNLSWSAFGKATELRQRIFFTIGLLIVYRVGTYIPVPGIDAVALQEFMEQAQQGIGGVLSMFTGGALALQVYSGGARFNAESVVPNIVAIAMTRELGPVLGGLMVAGRVAASIAAGTWAG